MNQNIITEQCGAMWLVKETGLIGERAYWLLHVGEAPSQAKPFLAGFYVKDMNEAAHKLSN